MVGADFGARLGHAAEASVVALAMSGDAQAFSELVRRRQAWLRGLLRRLCQDAALADDLAQQVFLSAWRHLPQLKSVAAFGGWLRRLAVNTYLAQRRGATLATTPLDEVPEHAGEPLSHAAARLDLDRALQRLPEPQRLCVVLAYSEGLSHAEIAATTGLPLGTVKSNITRGAQRLRAALAAYHPAEGHAHAG
jgi:RNA polymerase sigma factor (sigma-70 family)